MNGRDFRKTSAGTIALLLLLALTFLFPGCRSRECARMLACCREIEDRDAVGEACGSRANAVDDPKTCKTILDTVSYMFEERGETPPKVCQFESGEAK